MLGFACFPTISRALSVCLIEFGSSTQPLKTLNPTYIPPTPKSVITRKIPLAIEGLRVFNAEAQSSQRYAEKSLLKLELLC